MTIDKLTMISSFATTHHALMLWILGEQIFPRVRPERIGCMMLDAHEVVMHAEDLASPMEQKNNLEKNLRNIFETWCGQGTWLAYFAQSNRSDSPIACHRLLLYTDYNSSRHIAVACCLFWTRRKSGRLFFRKMAVPFPGRLRIKTSSRMLTKQTTKTHENKP
jgi:hypothetical protein